MVTRKKVKAAVWRRRGGTHSLPRSSLATIKRSICVYRNIRDVLLRKGLHGGFLSCMGAFKIYMRCSSGRQQRPPLVFFFPLLRGSNVLRPHQAIRRTPTRRYRCHFKEVPFKGAGRLQFSFFLKNGFFQLSLSSFLFCCI